MRWRRIRISSLSVGSPSMDATLAGKPPSMVDLLSAMWMALDIFVVDVVSVSWIKSNDY